MTDISKYKNVTLSKEAYAKLDMIMAKFHIKSKTETIIPEETEVNE
jgi:hypothetical protein